jgi:hypothetical protein
VCVCVCVCVCVTLKKTVREKLFSLAAHTRRAFKRKVFLRAEANKAHKRILVTFLFGLKALMGNSFAPLHNVLLYTLSFFRLQYRPLYRRHEM